MAEVSTYRPAKLVPLTNPRDVREATVRDYKRNAQRAGIDVPLRVLEQLATHDCQMADAYVSRGVDLSPPRTKPRPKARPVEPRDDLGGLMKAAPATRDKPLTVADFTALSARWPFAMGRMKRIIAGATPSRDPLQVAATCEMPVLAVEVIRLQRNWLMRHRDSRHNPFRGLNDIDARRALVRFVEDICDKSTGKMGPWWVPK